MPQSYFFVSCRVGEIVSPLNPLCKVGFGSPLTVN